MGINRDNSWDTIYAKKAGCSLEEAKKEMVEAFQVGMFTPDGWMDHKKNVLKEALNIEE